MDPTIYRENPPILWFHYKKALGEGGKEKLRFYSHLLQPGGGWGERERKEKKAKQGQKTNSGRAKTKVNGTQKWHVKHQEWKEGRRITQCINGKTPNSLSKQQHD